MLITLDVKLNKAAQLCVSVPFLLLQQNTDWAISNEKKFTAGPEAGKSQVEAPHLVRVTLCLEVAADIRGQRDWAGKCDCPFFLSSSHRHGALALVSLTLITSIGPSS